MGPERLARIARTDVVPVSIRRVGAIDYELRFGSPLCAPGESLEEGELTRRIFSEIESTVRAAPANWWCWEIFDGVMAADDDRTLVAGVRA